MNGGLDIALNRLTIIDATFLSSRNNTTFQMLLAKFDNGRSGQ